MGVYASGVDIGLSGEETRGDEPPRSSLKSCICDPKSPLVLAYHLDVAGVAGQGGGHAELQTSLAEQFGK